MSKRYCITIILGCVVVYFLLVAFCLSESLHQGVADDPTLKGKGKDAACMDYALVLSSRLVADGIHGQLNFYRRHIRKTAIKGSHMFVVYRFQTTANGSSTTKSRIQLMRPMEKRNPYGSICFSFQSHPISHGDRSGEVGLCPADPRNWLVVRRYCPLTRGRNCGSIELLLKRPGQRI